MNNHDVQLNGEVLTFTNNENALWEYSQGFYKAYTENYETKEDLVKIAGVCLANKYFLADWSPVGWDFVVPEPRLKTVLRILKSGG